jgi:hypothetical protein
MAAPVAARARQPEALGDARQAVAGGPAHHGRKGVHARAAAQLPQAGVGLVEIQRRALAERFELAEQRFVAASGQALVEEDVRRGEDRRAVDVVLHLGIGLVADAHRAHAAIAGQGRRLAFVERARPSMP